MKDTHLAIDLGTTNTVVARWNDEFDGPEILHIDSICRSANSTKEIDDSYTIPSCVYLRHPSEVLSFPWKYFFANFRSKTGAYIGRQALEKDGGVYRPCFVNHFKMHLGKNSFQFIGRLGRWKYTAEDVVRIFLKELFETVRQSINRDPEYVTFCAPVDFYEFYRARLQRICTGLGVESVKTIDEPVAAALGYGLSIDEPRSALVIDFGAGTLNIALIAIGEAGRDTGHCEVIAKDSISVGGTTVDSWIVEEICEYYGYDFARLSSDEAMRWWYRMLLGEACRIKESLFLKTRDTFFLMPSHLMAQYARAIPGERVDQKRPVDYTRDELVALLEKRGLYALLNNLIDSITQEAKRKGIGEKSIDDVLMVGGSTLLPRIYATVEKRFGRDRVRAWQPFNAVAFGAAAYAAGRFNKADHITHDYALMTYDRETHEPEYTVVVPRGTPYPTPRDFWRRQLIPTCALGEPERIFKLIICEIGRRHSANPEFVWDEKGALHLMKAGDDRSLVIPLNESDPTLGYLDPPHFPSEKRARVEISFMVNADRWLCASVYDLKTQKYLLEQKPVIRLK
ncbi:MAG TPA: Hsp70 family protein [Spirochaetota bacterium]|nr:Hsp70 family protein [Spirochaetota bacterium]HPI22438.1 Hsp70 family protein [Spirochaetota bacterium]HPU86878.1 Hsp70 family protein [Spirochaetota bacterium]